MVSTALGLAGVVLPLLPTTPFMILAALCFAKGSDKLHRWLMNHSSFGPAIRDWNRHGAIRSRAKMLAVIAMGVALLISVLIGIAWSIVAAQAAVMAVAATFVLTRPSPPS